MSKKNATAKIESETPKAETVNVDSEIEAIEKAKALLAAAKTKLSPEAKAALAEREKAEKAARANRVTRITAAVRAIQALNGDGRKVDDLVKDADRVYVEAGGESNEREARFSLNRTIDVAAAFGLVAEKDGVIAKK